MNILGIQVLSLFLFLPILGGLFLIFLKNHTNNIKYKFGLITVFTIFLCSLCLIINYQNNQSNVDWFTHTLWIKAFQIEYFLGIDYLSLFFIVITTFLFTIILISLWDICRLNINSHLISFLFFEFAVIGILITLDAFLWMFFWAIMLLILIYLILEYTPTAFHNIIIPIIIILVLSGILLIYSITSIGVFFYEQNQYFSWDITQWKTITIPVSYQKQLIWSLLGALFSPLIIFSLFTFLNRKENIITPFLIMFFTGGILPLITIYGFLRIFTQLLPAAIIDINIYLILIFAVFILITVLLPIKFYNFYNLIAKLAFINFMMILIGILTLTSEGLEGSLIFMVHSIILLIAYIVGIIILKRTQFKNSKQIISFKNFKLITPVFSIFFAFIISSFFCIPGFSCFNGFFKILIPIWEKHVLSAYIILLAFLILTINLFYFLKNIIFQISLNNSFSYYLKFYEKIIFTTLIILISLMVLKPNLFYLNFF